MKAGPEVSGFGDPSASDTRVPFQLLKCHHLGEGPGAASPSQPHSADVYPEGTSETLAYSGIAMYSISPGSPTRPYVTWDTD